MDMTLEWLRETVDAILTSTDQGFLNIHSFGVLRSKYHPSRQHKHGRDMHIIHSITYVINEHTHLKILHYSSNFLFFPSPRWICFPFISSSIAT